MFTECSLNIDWHVEAVEKISVLYNMACCHAGLGDTRAGISALKDAIDIGFDDFDTARSDPDLAALRSVSKCSLKDANCSRNDAKCSLNDAKCSLNHAINIGSDDFDTVRSDPDLAALQVKSRNVP
jgi:hypothetical protein